MVDGQAWTIFFCEYKSIECWVSEQSEGWLSSILCLIKTNYSAIPYVYLSTFFYNGTASAGMSGWTPAAANLPCLPIYCTTRQPARLLACLPARLLARTAAWVPSAPVSLLVHTWGPPAATGTIWGTCYNIHLKEMKHIEHTLVTYVYIHYNICNIQIKYI
jgi:hypothetical protein